jgi:acyl transferase domain-containing protein
MSISTAAHVVSLASSAVDAVGEVPMERWSLHDINEEEWDAEVLQRAQYGAFLLGADLFDNAKFRISRSEASAMDPQQRLLLESGYESLHNAGFNHG